jgi:adenosylcobinamide-phosphate synthase
VIAALLIPGLALLLDQWWGEPRRWHPLVGFGRCADALEARLNRGARRRARGVFALMLALAPPLAAALILQHWLRAQPVWVAAAVAASVLYLAIGRRSLAQHARAVLLALNAADLPAARAAVGRIVSRDTRALDSVGVSRAAVETVLENGSDAVLASLFWFALAGLPGVVLHRLANTLDAMWGYRSERLREFGWAAARFDDVLNFVPARLTAMGYALCGQTGAALRCWRRQARSWSSPNAGPVMAAGAGALQVRLGGAACYAGGLEQRAALGCGREPEARDIERALALLDRAVVLAVALLALTQWLWWTR